MRSANLHLRTLILSCLTLVVSGCQSAQNPVALLPPAPAPALNPDTSTNPPPSLQSPSQPATPTQEEQKPAETVAQSPAPQPAAPDAITDLVSKVEAEYQVGLANYKAGKTEDAKQNFDNAFNALLGSNLDVRSDKRLQDEFDHLVEGVNQLDLGGLTPDAEAQQKSEPAPIDETNEIAPSADPNVKAKAQAEIKSTRSDLPLMMTDQVAGYISYFSNRGRGTFEHAFSRSGRYHDMMVSILKE